MSKVPALDSDAEKVAESLAQYLMHNNLHLPTDYETWLRIARFCVHWNDTRLIFVEKLLGHFTAADIQAARLSAVTAAETARDITTATKSAKVKLVGLRTKLHDIVPPDGA